MTGSSCCKGRRRTAANEVAARFESTVTVRTIAALAFVKSIFFRNQRSIRRQTKQDSGNRNEYPCEPGGVREHVGMHRQREEHPSPPLNEAKGVGSLVDSIRSSRPEPSQRRPRSGPADVIGWAFALRTIRCDHSSAALAVIQPFFLGLVIRIQREKLLLGDQSKVQLSDKRWIKRATNSVVRESEARKTNIGDVGHRWDLILQIPPRSYVPMTAAESRPKAITGQCAVWRTFCATNDILTDAAIRALRCEIAFRVNVSTQIAVKLKRLWRVFWHHIRSPNVRHGRHRPCRRNTV